jgi:hypothetical protein
LNSLFPPNKADFGTGHRFFPSIRLQGNALSAAETVVIDANITDRTFSKQPRIPASNPNILRIRQASLAQAWHLFRGDPSARVRAKPPLMTSLYGISEND